MVSAAKRAGQAWVKFWFGADYAMPARLFQVLVPLLLACFIFTRTPDLRIFYTPDGLGALGIRDFEELRHRPSIFYVLGSYGWIQFGHWLLIGSLLAMVLGFFPRVASVVAWFLHMSFINRNPSVSFGVETISESFLFYLVFMSQGIGATSVGSIRRALGSMGFRLAQLQICIIYLFAGLDKARGMTWWRGDALWQVLSNPQMASLDLGFFANFPMLLSVATIGTLFWEIYFPALVWLRWARYPMLLWGVALHLGIAVSMTIPSFGFLMIFSYAVFLEPAHAESILRRLSLRSVWKKTQVARTV
jgi:hypothetical protein